MRGSSHEWCEYKFVVGLPVGFILVQVFCGIPNKFDSFSWLVESSFDVSSGVKGTVGAGRYTSPRQQYFFWN